jgi:hypothetical protein
MDPQLLYEMIGYAASVLVALSLMMRSILKLRILNLIGAFFFTIYGLVIQAYPVAGVNFFIVLINIYYLYQIFSAREYFNLLPVHPSDSYLSYFLDLHKAEILKFEPAFSFDLDARQWIFFSLRGAVPAGLFVAEQTGPGTLFVQLDFVIPGYRDLKLGKFLYQAQKAGIFQERGIHTIYSRPGSPEHSRYLRRMGFVSYTAPDGEQLYRLQLKGVKNQSETPQHGGSA